MTSDLDPTADTAVVQTAPTNTVNRDGQGAVLADAAGFVRDFSDGKTSATRQGYLTDIRSFSRFVTDGDEVAAVRLLLEGGAGAANRLVHRYRQHLIGRRLAPNTVNRHLTSLGSVVSYAHWIGLVPWRLQVKRLRARRIRDARGPGVTGVRSIISTALVHPNLLKGIRDTAALWLMFGCALRVSEVASLRITDVDERQQILHVAGKGLHERAPVCIPDPAMEALRRWLRVRESNVPPLFYRLDRGHGGRPITRRGLFKMVRLHASQTGIITRPHGLRHAAITSAFLQGLPLRDIMAFSRHRSADGIAHYDDALRHEVGGKIADRVASSLGTVA